MGDSKPTFMVYRRRIPKEEPSHDETLQEPEPPSVSNQNANDNDVDPIHAHALPTSQEPIPPSDDSVQEPVPASSLLPSGSSKLQCAPFVLSFPMADGNEVPTSQETLQEPEPPSVSNPIANDNDVDPIYAHALPASQEPTSPSDDSVQEPVPASSLQCAPRVSSSPMADRNEVPTSQETVQEPPLSDSPTQEPQRGLVSHDSKSSLVVCSGRRKLKVYNRKKRKGHADDKILELQEPRAFLDESLNGNEDPINVAGVNVNVPAVLQEPQVRVQSYRVDLPDKDMDQLSGLLGPGENSPGAVREVMMHYQHWQRKFHGKEFRGDI